MGSFLTQNLFLPLSDMRRQLKSATRDVFQAYKSGMEFRREAFGWSADQKRDWILKRLRTVLREAATNTDYYNEVFKRAGFDPESDFSFEDFAKLPILERSDITENGAKMVSSVIARGELLQDGSGGSTGTPTIIWLGPEERGWKESGTDFSMERIGVKRGSRTGYFWGHHLDPQKGANIRERLQNFAENLRWYDCFRLSDEKLGEYFADMKAWLPECVIAYANPLAALAEFIKKNGLDPNGFPQKCFVTGAEKLYAHQRETVEEVFGKPVHERYGGRDFGGIGLQTDPRISLNYEIDWAWALVEPETTDEISSIIVTKLHADGMPMIRYRVGDMGRFDEAAKSGEPSFFLKEVVGRDLDRIWLKNGGWLSGIEIPHLLKTFAIREYIFEQAEDFKVELKFVPYSGFTENDEIEVRNVLQANLPDIPVTLLQVDEIPKTKANKWRPVITKVKQK